MHHGSILLLNRHFECVTILNIYYFMILLVYIDNQELVHRTQGKKSEHDAYVQMYHIKTLKVKLGTKDYKEKINYVLYWIQYHCGEK